MTLAWDMDHDSMENLAPEVKNPQPEVDRRLTSMNVGMFLHVRFLMKAFSTVWARERSSIGVN